MPRKFLTVHVKVPRLCQLKSSISNAPMVNMNGVRLTFIVLRVNKVIQLTSTTFGHQRSVHDLKHIHTSQLELINNLKQQEARLQRDGVPYDADGSAQVMCVTSLHDIAK